MIERTLAILLAALIFLQPAQAQDALSADSLVEPEEKIEEQWPDAALGTYGYRHSELHHYGTIQQLMDITNTKCCDGGEGGECRVTEIRLQSPTSFFNHNGTWCPLDEDTVVNLVDLPPDAEAVVCAGTRKVMVGEYKGCPVNTHCAGIEGTS